MVEFGFNPVTKASQTDHKRGKKKKKDRGEFTPKVRKQIIQNQAGRCYLCGRSTTYIHHVKPRGRGGRGVVTNGMLACTNCHNPKIHDIGMVDHYMDVWKQKHGPEYWMDELDRQQKTKGMF